ncbi:hypothetical protein BBO01nite_39080 [Brevibacillus borstelensis]|jgi:hypothetical protein|nr:hypothetical protein BBO01nite_39080 [Brevibacillus borstelensis]
MLLLFIEWSKYTAAAGWNDFNILLFHSELRTDDNRRGYTDGGGEADGKHRRT